MKRIFRELNILKARTGSPSLTTPAEEAIDLAARLSSFGGLKLFNCAEFPPAHNTHSSSRAFLGILQRSSCFWYALRVLRSVCCMLGRVQTPQANDPTSVHLLRRAFWSQNDTSSLLQVVQHSVCNEHEWCTLPAKKTHLSDTTTIQDAPAIPA